jgi:hypothetical protein
MAMIFTALAGIGSSIAGAAGTAGSFLAANAGTIGTALTAVGTIYGGVQANKAAKVEAKSLQKKGDNELAIGQRQALRARQEKERVLSRQRAVAAASGAGATDPSVEAVMGKTEQEGEYNALLEMYRGQQNRADLYAEAKTRRKEGKSALVGSFIDAGGTIYSSLDKSRRAKREFDYEPSYG